MACTRNKNPINNVCMKVIWGRIRENEIQNEDKEHGFNERTRKQNIAVAAANRNNEGIGAGKFTHKPPQRKFELRIREYTSFLPGYKVVFFNCHLLCYRCNTIF